MFRAIDAGLLRRKIVACLDVVEINDFHLVALRYGVLHYVGTPAGHCNEYLIHLHRGFSLIQRNLQKNITPKSSARPFPTRGKPAEQVSPLPAATESLLGWGFRTRKGGAS